MMGKTISEKKISLLIGSLFAFLQLSCAYVFGVTLDGGLTQYSLGILAGLGMVACSLFMCFYAKWMGEKKDGYQIFKTSIPSSFWYLYALITGCVLCFALFGLLSLGEKNDLFSHTSFVSLCLPTLTATLDGFAFFAARQIARREQ